MQVQVTKITSESKLPGVVARVFTEGELKQEYNYYLAQQLLSNLLSNGFITEDEFNKITKLNRKKFSPYLSEIMH